MNRKYQHNSTSDWFSHCAWILWTLVLVETGCYDPEPRKEKASTSGEDTSSSTMSGEEVINDEDAPNLCPKAGVDHYVVAAGQQFVVGDVKNGLLSNDQDPDGNILQVEAAENFESQKHAEVSIFTDGTFNYFPKVPFWGADEFTYYIYDSQGCKVEGKVLISVQPKNISLENVAAGHGGFALDGEAIGDLSGSSVSSAGDVNGDGLADLVIGASKADSQDKTDAGRSYVVLGSPELTKRTFPISLKDLIEGYGGFALDGEAIGDLSGSSVSSAGDVNGDGLADLVIGASKADSQDKTDAGRSYVVLGNAEFTGFESVVSLTDATSMGKGFVLDGEANYLWSSRAVNSAGDVNGDGFSDVLIGANATFPNGSYSGRSYLVFGSSSEPVSPLSLTTIALGQGGIALHGEAAGECLGTSLASAGDVNGDGYVDFIVSAPGSINCMQDQAYNDKVGRSYVVFGRPEFTLPIVLTDIASGKGGFALDGEELSDHSGNSVSGVGDVNGDGYADLIIGAKSKNNFSGHSYVVFGRPTWTSPISLADIASGKGGFALDGENIEDNSGASVSRAGDINGDGYADFLIGAPKADPQGETDAGRSYVIFGSSELNEIVTPISLADIIEDKRGFVLNGEKSGDTSGASVSGAGDVNGDGYSDITIGAAHVDSLGGPDAGRSYVIFGDDFTGTVDFRPTDGNDTFVGTPAAESMLGGIGNDQLIGNGGADVLYGGPGDDIIAITGPAISIGLTDITSSFSAAVSPGFFRIDGGPGEDTLRLDGRNMHLDLRKIPELALQNMEVIDLNGNGNQLTLEVRDIVASSNTSNTLKIEGDGTNKISADLTGAQGLKYNEVKDGYMECISTNEALILRVSTGIKYMDIRCNQQ